MDKIISLCKRRGIIFPSSDIYGGSAGLWDYGPSGVEIKKNIRDLWWNHFVHCRDDIMGLESTILTPTPVLKASGHLDKFTDMMHRCQKCGFSWKFDETSASCPKCHNKDTHTTEAVNLMFSASDNLWLRPETAQGIFINFNNVFNTTRKKLPFGVAQIGKAFRNEPTTGNFIFRTREFEMMEVEYFVWPGTEDLIHARWVGACLDWYRGLGIRESNLRLHSHAPDELAHYSKATVDIEYNFPFGWGEIAGIANRTNYDLSAHQFHSGKSITVWDEEHNQHIIPCVIEPSMGVDRLLLAILVDAYTEEDVPTASGSMTKRTVLKLHPSIAPIKIAVLPLSDDEQLTAMAYDIYTLLQRTPTIRGMVQYDDTQSIGKRYRRQDEIGTPTCVTIDFDSLNDNQVTIRDRDTMLQIRIPIDNLVPTLITRLYEESNNVS